MGVALGRATIAMGGLRRALACRLQSWMQLGSATGRCSWLSGHQQHPQSRDSCTGVVASGATNSLVP